jgi:hypothetical protein
MAILTRAMLLVVCCAPLGASARAEQAVLSIETRPSALAYRWESPRVASLAFAQSARSAMLMEDGAPVESPVVAKPERSALRSVLFGTIAGVAGFALGARLGDVTSDVCDHATEICIEPGAFLGAAGGGTLGIALGSHWGNDGRGDLGKDFLVAAGIWAMGIALAFGTAATSDEATVGILVAIPIVQIGTTVAVERAAGRKRTAGSP